MTSVQQQQTNTAVVRRALLITRSYLYWNKRRIFPIAAFAQDSHKLMWPVCVVICAFLLSLCVLAKSVPVASFVRCFAV